MRGCYTCIARKLKCDTPDPSGGDCANCRRIQEPCRRWPDNDLALHQRSLESKSYTLAGIKRRRSVLSCQRCRRLKKKCDGEHPCGYCVRTNGGECSYDPKPIKREPRSQKQAQSQQPGPSRSLGRSSSSARPSSTSSLSTSTGVGSGGPADGATTGPQQFPDVSKIGVVGMTGGGGTGGGVGIGDLGGLQKQEFSSRTAFAQSCGCAQFPKTPMLKALAKDFFTLVAPCRQMGFLHEPTIMKSIDDPTYGTQLDDLILLLSLSAAASKMDHGTKRSLWELGSIWARDAFRLLISSLNAISVTKLMATILLIEHENRCGNHSSCFLLNSLTTRYTHILQLNVEYDSDILCQGPRPALSSRQSPSPTLSPTEKESRRRLMWCCTFLDSLSASGVSQLQLLHEPDISIQLPLSDDNFLHERPGYTETIARGQLHKSAPPNTDLKLAAQNMDHRAYLVRIFTIRHRVLNYVKRFHHDENIWNPTSEYSQLVQDLHGWITTLPSDWAMNPATIYIRKSQGLLIALLELHIWYHLCFIDLYRIVVPGLSHSLKSQIDAIQIAAPAEFVTKSHDSCFEHAWNLTRVLETGLHNAEDGLLSDPYIVLSAHEATRAILAYAVVSSKRLDRQYETLIEGLLKTNVDYLKQSVIKVPSTAVCLVRTAFLVRKVQLPYVNVSALELPNEQSDVMRKPQDTIEENLHPLSIYRMVTSNVQKRHGKKAADPPDTGLGGVGTPVQSTIDAFFGDPAAIDMMIPFTLEGWLSSNQFGELI